MHRRPVEFQIGDYVIVFAQRAFPQEPSLNCILIVLVLKFCNELDQMLTSLISYVTMVLARPLMLRTLLPLKAMSPHQMILFLLPLLLHLCLPCCLLKMVLMVHSLYLMEILHTRIKLMQF